MLQPTLPYLARCLQSFAAFAIVGRRVRIVGGKGAGAWPTGGRSAGCWRSTARSSCAACPDGRARLVAWGACVRVWAGGSAIVSDSLFTDCLASATYETARGGAVYVEGGHVDDAWGITCTMRLARCED